MKGALETAVNRLDRMLSLVSGRIAAPDRFVQGGAFLGLAVLCRLDPTGWDDLTDRAQVTGLVDAIEDLVLRQAAGVERVYPALRGVLTEHLLAHLLFTRPRLLSWIIEIQGHSDAIQSVEGEAFSKWINRTITAITSPSPTPAALVRLMSTIAGPGRSAFDPFCRTGELLASSISDFGRDRAGTEIVGMTPYGGDAALARLRFFFAATPAEIHEGDAVGGPLSARGRLRAFDRVMCDPPFARRISLADFPHAEIRYWLGRDVRSVASETAYVRLAMEHLTQDGVAVVRVPLGMLFRGGVDAYLRRTLIGDDVVAAVVGLPAGMVPGVAIESALIVLDRNKAVEREGHVVVVDASMTSPDTPHWVETVSGWVHSPESAPENVRVLSLEEIASSDFQLQPRVYLSADHGEDEAAPQADPRRWEEILASQREANELSERMDELLSTWFSRRR